MNLSHRTPRMLPAVLLFVLLSAVFPSKSAEAGGPFDRYSPEVAEQADLVLATAADGQIEAFQKEVRELGRRMRRRGILSINALPDLVYSKSVRERWGSDSTPHLRSLTRVAPLSVPLWGILLRMDITSFNVEGIVEDAKGIAGAVQCYGPALMGYVVWVGSFAAASASWFAAWGALVLFLRIRPSLELDLQRILGSNPVAPWVAAVVAFLLFILPLVFGVGLVLVSAIWLLLTTPYLREKEKIIKTLAVVLLMVVLTAGTVVGLARQSAGDTRKGGWLGGEGYIPDSFPEGDSAEHLEELEWMVRFARARADMQAGRAEDALQGFDRLVSDGRATPEVVNNRGIALAQLGRFPEALTDFEAAAAAGNGHAPALWNAYQVYLKTFRLEKGQSVQAQAWAGLKTMSPFGYQPSEFEPGEWIASSVPVSSIWTSLLGGKFDLMGEAGTNDIFRLYFHPLTPVSAVVVLVLVLLFSLVARVFVDKLWVSATCRACGTGNLAVGNREAASICNLCKAMIGVGTRSGEERERRIQTIVMHRRYVNVTTVLVPGSGFLWSGKDGIAIVYGLLLSMFLGMTTVSSGVGGGDATITGHMAGGLAILSFAGVVVLWIVGALWGHSLYRSLQNRHNLAGVRR